MLKLVQVRTCDGECCREHPRFPNTDHSDCIYHDGKDKIHGCALQRNPALIPSGMCPVINMTAKQAVQETCIDWPQNIPTPRLGKTGDCCWQFVDDGR